MSAVTLFDRAIEATAERLIRTDPKAAELLAPLEGRAIAIALTGTGIERVLLVIDGHLRVLAPDAARPADARITGAPVSFARLASGTPARELAAGLRIEGDAELADAADRVFKELRIDWEALVAPVVGDVIAHQGGRAAEALRGEATRAVDHLVADLADWLKHEARLLPLREEVEPFLDAVDRLRDDVDRCEARIERIERRNAPKPP